MKWLMVCFRKTLRLFVDDRMLAVASVIWLLVVWLLLPHLQVPAPWRGVLLFLGLATILMASVLHRARR